MRVNPEVKVTTANETTVLDAEEEHLSDFSDFSDQDANNEN